MTVQTAPRVPFRPAQCPSCVSYMETINRCRAFVTESYPRPLLGILSGETDEPCPKYMKQKAEGTTTPPSDLPAEQHSPSDQVLPSNTVEAAPSQAQAETDPRDQDPGVEEQPASLPHSGQVEPEVPKATPEEIYHKAQIHCQRCKTENPPTALRCQNCDANLLPGETLGQRVVLFFTFLVVAGLLAFLFYRFYIQEPGSAPDIVLCNQGALVGGAFLSFIMAFVSLFRKTAEYEKYVNRARRHLNLNAWQSLDDLNRAMDLAPEKEQMGLVKQRAKVFEKLGLSQDAARDHLSLVTSPKAYKGEGEWVSALTGADADVFSSSMRSSQIKTMLSSGKVTVVGYCKRCKEVIELNADQRCPIHPKDKGLEAKLVIPADILAGKLAVMQKLEHRYSHLGTQVTEMLEAGQAKAIGYCQRCKAVVQLDSKRHCTVHSSVKGRKVQYVVPGQEARAKQVILRWRRTEQLSSRRRWLMVAGLVLLAYAVVKILFPGEVTQIFEDLLNGFR